MVPNDYKGGFSQPVATTGFLVFPYIKWVQEPLAWNGKLVTAQEGFGYMQDVLRVDRLIPFSLSGKWQWRKRWQRYRLTSDRA